MKFFRFLPLMLLYSLAFADEKVDLDANQRISVYLHPFSLISSMASGPFPALFYITAEYPLSSVNSLIINPSVWTGGEDVVFRIGTGVGIRRFANGEANGLYLQLMPSIHYLSIEEDTILDIKTTGVMADILGYIGYSAKYSSISVFFDIGIGYQWVSLSKDRSEKDGFSVSVGGSGGSLSLDINLGIGIPF